ncbi:MAG: NUDIX hydrolase [Treponema sp.]|jgi:8-oxo-dGTP pyrophosphatase MutT (NUDIX family)|nr:NUDIX hydrolase [Treponema sp.]
MNTPLQNMPNNYERLVWREEDRKNVYTCRIFSIHESMCRSPDKKHRSVFTVLDATDWAMVVPVLEKDGQRFFVMVRQWRHGARELSLEFPGGVLEAGEDPTQASLRELEEETAYTAKKITKIGEMSPNPAIMNNYIHFFLAEELSLLSSQRLDEDEYVDMELVPIEKVMENIGKKPYIHALVGTALALWRQNQETIP